jgi:hypothetical protein
MTPILTVYCKAARVLKQSDQRYWEDLDLDLTIAERSALEHENGTSFFQQEWSLQSTFSMLFIAAVVQGWNQTSINSANLSWPGEFGLIDNDEECGPTGFKRETWWFAVVNAAPFLAASL